jgi:hypothetical protein
LYLAFNSVKLKQVYAAWCADVHICILCIFQFTHASYPFQCQCAYRYINYAYLRKFCLIYIIKHEIIYMYFIKKLTYSPTCKDISLPSDPECLNIICTSDVNGWFSLVIGNSRYSFFGTATATFKIIIINQMYIYKMVTWISVLLRCMFISI